MKDKYSFITVKDRLLLSIAGYCCQKAVSQKEKGQMY